MNPSGPILTIVIPTFNESHALSANLPGWVEFAEDNHWLLVFVDDGSSDRTSEVLRPYLSHSHLRVLKHPINRGYGAAIKTGIYQATTPYVATMDADGQHTMNQMVALYEEMLASSADIVIGSRPTSATRDLYRRLGKAIIRRLTRILFASEIRDLNSGMRVYKTDIVKKLLRYSPDSMAFSDTIALLHLNTKCELREIPITVQPRAGGESTINTMTAVDTALEIVNIVMWFRPLRILLPFSVLLVSGGAVWSIPFLLAGRGLSSVALLLILSGFQVAVLALLAEQFSQIRRLDIPNVGYAEATEDDKSS